jgi:hypothetical protein
MAANTAFKKYSLVEEAHQIFSLLCDHSVELNIPAAAVKHKERVCFNLTHDQIYYPIPLQVTETLAALKGVEGTVAAALADTRFGPSQERKARVNLERATAFGFKSLVVKMDNMSRVCPEVKAKLKGVVKSLFCFYWRPDSLTKQTPTSTPPSPVSILD